MSIRPFGRLRVGNSAPTPSALKVGELVASRQGVLYLGVGTGTGAPATSVVSFSGASTATGSLPEPGGVIYSDEQATSGATYIMLAAPVPLTITHVSTKTGSGTCTVQLKSGIQDLGSAVTASSTVSRVTLEGSSVTRRVVAGEPLQLQVSNATDLTSLIVQVDWLEG